MLKVNIQPGQEAQAQGAPKGGSVLHPGGWCLLPVSLGFPCSCPP